MNQHSEIETEGGDMFTTKQIKELQKRNTQLKKIKFKKKRLPSSLPTQTKIKCYFYP